MFVEFLVGLSSDGVVVLEVEEDVLEVELGVEVDVVSMLASASIALAIEFSFGSGSEFTDDGGLVVVMLEGKIVESSSMLRSIVLLMPLFLLVEKEESISMKMETQAAAVRDLKPFLKFFCLEGMSFLISKIAFILVSLSRTLKKLSAC